MTDVGTVFGQALYALALEEALTGEILPQLALAESCFAAQPDYVELLSCRSIPKQERCALLEESFRDALHPYVRNLLKLLVERGGLRHFSRCCAVYRESYNRDNGILPVTAATALPLTDAQTQRLRERLSALTGKKIELSNRIEPELLGGVRLDYDGRQLEDSIAHRLDAIRQTLKNTVL